MENKFKIGVTAAVIVVSALLLIGRGQAQIARPVAKVKVRVVDRSGAVIPDGEVVFKKDSQTITSHTGQEGTTTVALPSGRYSVTVTQPGFLKEEVMDFQVAAPEPKEINVVLKVDPHPVMCGPCGCVCSTLVPTTPPAPDPENEIKSRPLGAPSAEPVSAQPALTKKRSARCLYLWKCSGT